MDGAKAVKKHNAQYDIFNRIHSIASDQAFVQQVAQEWFQGRFEVVPNQRCGTWYCPPTSTYAYFKSTDGHTNNWSFNLRRANIPLAKYAEDNGGLILVDSTRRGKRMPDALSKTVPVWCAVINRAVHQRKCAQDSKADNCGWEELYLPAGVVSPSERQQIIDLLPSWTENLLSSNIPLPDLSKPLRPFFIHPSTSQSPHIPSDTEYIPIICLSASRWIGITGQQDEVPSVTRVGSRNVGFEYVPGAGDDDELWAKGLTPAVYWRERDMLLSLDREELEEGLERAKSQPASELVSGLSGLDVGEKSEGTNTPASTSRLVGAPHPTSRLALDIGPPVSPVDPWHAIPTEDSITIYLVSIPKAQLYPDVIYSNPTTKGSMGVAIPSPKSDSWAYKDSLMKLVSALKIYEKSNMILKAGTTDHLDLIIKATAEDKDISQTLCDMPSPEDAVSSRKSVIPVALLLLCAFSLDNDLPRTGNGTEEGLSKGSISSVLLSLVALWPDSNPPRAALKRVNEVLLGRS